MMHNGLSPEELEQRLTQAELTVEKLRREVVGGYKEFFDNSAVAMAILEFDLDETGRPADFRLVQVKMWPLKT